MSIKGGLGKVYEYTGPGVETLEVPQRATIANMGAEMGATSSIFPADAQVKKFLTAQHRPMPTRNCSRTRMRCTMK